MINKVSKAKPTAIISKSNNIKPPLDPVVTPGMCLNCRLAACRYFMSVKRSFVVTLDASLYYNIQQYSTVSLFESFRPKAAH
jgi:hypothetical protein